MAAEKSKSSKKQSQVMDVSKPGSAAPSASSRPIIVGHKPTVKDPMVSDAKQDDASTKVDDTEQQVKVKRTVSKVIAPLSDKVEPEEDSVDGEDKPELDAAEDTQEAAQEEAQADMRPSVDDSTADEGGTATESPAGSEGGGSSKKDSQDKSSSVVSAIVDQATKKKNGKDAKAEEERQKRQAEIDKLAEEKKYYVHTSTPPDTKRRTRWLTIFVMLLLLIGGYLALDAQLIKNDLVLPYEFFKESEEVVPTAGDETVEGGETAEDIAEQEPQDSEGSNLPSLQATDQANDAERQNDLRAIQSSLEMYFSDNGFYPTLDQANDKEFQAASNLEADSLTDPDGESSDLVSSPKAGSYAYRALPADCDNIATQCLEYELIATLSSGEEYVLESVNQVQ